MTFLHSLNQHKQCAKVTPKISCQLEDNDPKMSSNVGACQKIPMTLCWDRQTNLATATARWICMTRNAFSSHYQMSHIKDRFCTVLIFFFVVFFLCFSSLESMCSACEALASQAGFKDGYGWVILLAYVSHAGRRCHIVDNRPVVTSVHLMGSTIAKTTAAAQEWPLFLTALQKQAPFLTQTRVGVWWWWWKCHFTIKVLLWILLSDSFSLFFMKIWP